MICRTRSESAQAQLTSSSTTIVFEVGYDCDSPSTTRRTWPRSSTGSKRMERLPKSAGRDQEVLDQFCQLAALPGDDCHQLADLFLAELIGPVDDRLGETDDRCEWGPDLVAHGRQEAVFDSLDRRSASAWSRRCQ